MVLGIQHVVLYAALFEHAADELGYLYGNRTDQYGLSRLMGAYDLFDYRFVFAALMSIDRIVHVISDDRFVGRDDDNVHVVDVAELVFLGLGCTGHTGELVVHPEVVLERDGGESLGLRPYLDAFLGFDGLVQTV